MSDEINLSEKILTDMDIATRLTPENAKDRVPADLINEFAQRLKTAIVDPEDPVAKYNLFRDRAIDALYARRNFVLALHDPQKFFEVQQHLRQQLEGAGFTIEMQPASPGKVRLIVQEKDATEWKETAVGELPLTSELANLWNRFWQREVNSMTEVRGAPLREVKMTIAEFKQRLQS